MELEGFTVTKDMVKFKKTKKTIEEEKFLPSVIEPSFGIGRILYALLEHSFFQSPEDEQRVAMRFNSMVSLRDSPPWRFTLLCVCAFYRRSPL